MGACQSQNQYFKLKRTPNAPRRTFDGKTRLAKLTDIYDGDTVIIITNLTNQEPYYEYHLRLIGIDAPEIKPHLAVPFRNLHIAAASCVRDILREQLLKQRDGLVMIDFTKEEKYGRLLGTIWTVKRKKLLCITYGWRKDVNVSTWLISNNLVLPYHGGTKSEFTKEFLHNIVNSKALDQYKM
jgi:endonuclease YncB( thermonuclease family)